jgi:hypothetical protein
MRTSQVQRATGRAGVAIGLSPLVVIPLYFMYSGAPPASNVLSRNLIGMIVGAVMIVFFAGFAHLIRKYDEAFAWIASVVYGAGLIYVTLLLVGMSLEVGAIFGGPPGTIDPTIQGPLAEGTMMIHGSIGRVLHVVILTSAGYAILGTGMLPAWLGRAAYGIALINVAFIPSLFFGRDAATFYSAIGWGNSALVASLIGYWMLAAGVVLLRQASHETAPTKTRQSVLA